MDQRDEEPNEVKEVEHSRPSNVVNVGGKDNPTFIGDGTTVNINVKNTVKIDAKEYRNWLKSNNFKAISDCTDDIYDDRKIGVTNDTEYELPIESLASRRAVFEEPTKQISQEFQNASLPSTSQDFFAVDGNRNKVDLKRTSDISSSTDLKTCSYDDEEKKFQLNTNNRKKDRSNVRELAEMVDVFCSTSSELERAKFEESIHADLNSLSVTFTDCQICQMEHKMREFLLRGDTENVINSIGIYALILTVMLQYGLQPHLQNKTTIRSLCNRLKRIVEPSNFFPMSLVRRDIETVITMLSNTARFLRGGKLKNAENLIQRINEKAENKTLIRDVRKYLVRESWIQHYVIISRLKMQILIQRKQEHLEAFLQIVEYLSTSLKNTNPSYRWKFTITVVDSLVQITRNISDPLEIRVRAISGLSVLYCIFKKRTLHECLKIFHERVRILAYIENVSLRRVLLGGIFKDLDTSSEEMCKERLKCCSKDLQLSAIRQMIHNGNHAWIFSASSDKNVVIAKCYKQTRAELLNSTDPRLNDFDYECKFLSRLRNKKFQHPNVVRLIAHDERHKCISLEPVLNGNLLKFLRNRRSDILSPKLTELLSMAVQIADALEFLEKECIVHLAMQAGNVLLHDNDNVKLTGFQFCRNLEETGLKTAVKKRNFKWMDPQALAFESVSPKTVSWSFGVFLYELFTLGCVPFNQPENDPEHGEFKRESLNSDQARIFVIRGGKLPKESCIPENIFSIISEKCLQTDYLHRASPGELRDLLLKQLNDSRSYDKICHPLPELIRKEEDLSPEDYNPGIDDYDDKYPFVHLDVLEYAWNKEYPDEILEDGYSNTDPGKHGPVLCKIKRKKKNHEYEEIRVLEYMEFRDIKLVEELQGLDCPELVKVVAVNPFGPTKLEMISQSFSQGNVLDAMLKRPELLENLKTYVRQAASAVLYLHRQGIVHRNLKAENFLLMNDLTIKLGYLGMSMKEVNVNSTYSDPRIMERPYRADPRRDAPEVLEYGNYTRRSDVWSFGVVMWELHKVASSLPGSSREDVQPYSNTPDNKVLELVLSRKLLQNPDPHSYSLYNVYNMCWEWDSEDRPSILALLGSFDREENGEELYENICEVYDDVGHDETTFQNYTWKAARFAPSGPETEGFFEEENLYMEIPDVISQLKRSFSEEDVLPKSEQNIYVNSPVAQSHACKANGDVYTRQQQTQSTDESSEKNVYDDVAVDTNEYGIGDTKSHYCPISKNDDLATPEPSTSTSLPDKQFDCEANNNVHRNQPGTCNKDVCAIEGIYDDVAVHTNCDDHGFSDTTGHYYSPVCEDDVLSKTLEDGASLLEVNKLPDVDEISYHDHLSMEECDKMVEDKHGNTTENAEHIHCPVAEDDTFCFTNDQLTSKKSDEISTNYRESKHTDKPPRENGDDAAQREMCFGEIESKPNSAYSSERKDDSNVEILGDSGSDIALNIGKRGHVKSVLAMFNSAISS